MSKLLAFELSGNFVNNLNSFWFKINKTNAEISLGYGLRVQNVGSSGSLNQNGQRRGTACSQPLDSKWTVAIRRP